jgi:hypothetical protein
MSSENPAIGGLADRCLRFVEEQSCGEWGEAIENADAANLLTFVQAEIAAERERCAKVAHAAIQAEMEKLNDSRSKSMAAIKSGTLLSASFAVSAAIRENAHVE